MHRASIVIVTPALAAANNGNWQTARRWGRMLGSAYRVRITEAWQAGDEDLMIALHARKSAAAIAAWRAQAVRRPLLLVLTGTDLYRDIDADEAARRSLDAADLLVALNTLGPRRLPPALRGRCRVVLQSCAGRQVMAKSAGHLRALMVGHLREEKDPRTYWAAVRGLAGRGDLRFDHVGAALDARLGEEAQALATAHARFRWLGGLPHEATRRRIQAAHLLVHPSRMEGGAHVIIEALRSGTPVLASAIDGNVGLLGEDHAGLFAPGDAAGLSRLLVRARDEAGLLAHLTAQGAAKADRFAPAAERAALLACVHHLLDP